MMIRLSRIVRAVAVLFFEWHVEQELAAGLEDALHLCERRRGVQRVLEHVMAYEHVGAAVRESPGLTEKFNPQFTDGTLKKLRYVVANAMGGLQFRKIPASTYTKFNDGIGGPDVWSKLVCPQPRYPWECFRWERALLLVIAVSGFALIVVRGGVVR